MLRGTHFRVRCPSIEFERTGTDDDELLGALRLIAELAGNPRRWLPGFTPSAFIDQQWRLLGEEQSRLLTELAHARDLDAEAQLRDGDLIVEAKPTTRTAG